MKLSIITINYNNIEGLKETVYSVLEQNAFNDFEYIIIDGGSSDGSKEFIEKCDRIDYWVSEADSGVYNAMNKGIKVATGEYCIFMNSGDVFYDKDVLKNVFRYNLSEDFVVGNHFSKGKINKAPENITAFDIFYNALCHQSVFIKTKILKDDPYDETLSLVADWKHMFEWLALKNATYKHIDIVICKYDNTGMSSKQWKLVRQEREDVKKKLLPQRIYEDYNSLKLQKELQNYNPSLYEALKIVSPGGFDNKIILSIIKLKRISAIIISSIKKKK